MRLDAKAYPLIMAEGREHAVLIYQNGGSVDETGLTLPDSIEGLKAVREGLPLGRLKNVVKQVLFQKENVR